MASQEWLLVVEEVIRQYRVSDEEAIVALPLRGWAPVFDSLEMSLGRELFELLHEDWRRDQEEAVAGMLAANDAHVWLAEGERGICAFLVARLHAEDKLGEIAMLAVDPDAHSRGIGTALSEYARMRESGMLVAMVESGGDPGHAPARRVYEKSGYRLLPRARYFKPL